MLALMFPGQGSQKVGMMKGYLKSHPEETRKIANVVDEILGFRLSSLLLNETPDARMQLTANAQPAILATSILALKISKIQQEECRFMMGHSLGEYTAMVAADCISFEDAIELVHFRGKVMQEAMEDQAGCMAALMPMDEETVHGLICDTKKLLDDVEISVANFNSRKQIVVSGHQVAVDELIRIGKKDKRIRRAIKLPVSAAFHSPLMKSAALRMERKLENIDIVHARKIVSNVSATEAFITKKMLVEHMTAPVRWYQSVDYCVAKGCEKFLEIGHGTTLQTLLRQI